MYLNKFVLSKIKIIGFVVHNKPDIFIFKAFCRHLQNNPYNSIYHKPCWLVVHFNIYSFRKIRSRKFSKSQLRIIIPKCYIAGQKWKKKSVLQTQKSLYTSTHQWATEDSHDFCLNS